MRRNDSIPSVLLHVLVVASMLLAFGSARVTATDGKFVSSAACTDMVYDDARGILYLTSGSNILRYSTITKSFLTTFPVGGTLIGIDLSPDGNTLAVADSTTQGDSWPGNGGTCWIYLVNTETGANSKVTFIRDYGESGTYSVAYGADGNILTTSYFSGSGWVPLRRYNPSTSTTTLLGDVRQNSLLCASADRSVIGFEESNISDGEFGRYRVLDGSLLRKSGYTDGTSAFNYSVGTSRNGGQYAILYSGGAAICNADLVKTSKIMSDSTGAPLNVVYNPVRDIVYFSWSNTSKVKAFDTATLSVVREFDFGVKFGGGGAYGAGRLKTSRDGTLMFALFSNGFNYVRLNNEPPVASAQAVTTTEDTPVSVSLSARDPENDPLTYTITGSPAHGTLSGTAPNLTYTPAANYNGTDSFTYKANDGDADSALTTVSISVTPVDDAPVANAQTVTINEEDVVNITLSGSDVDGDALTYKVVEQPKHGVISGTAPNLVYTVSIGYYGPDTFRFKVTGAGVGSNPAAVSININAVPHVSIGAAKKLKSGSLVLIEDAVVTAPGLQTGVSFISASDRSAGIKLLSSNTLSIGQRLRIKGTIGRVDGEWQLSSCTFSKAEPGDPVKPVGMPTRTIANNLNENLYYTGINTTGLLVRACGTVSAVLPTERVVYIKDGFYCSDGIGPWPGLRVQFPAGATLPTKGKVIVVTGISRVEKRTLTQWGEINGYWYPAGTVVYVPSLWLRTLADFRTM